MIVSRHKYNAREAFFRGRRFRSQLERDYAVELAARELAGDIRDLEYQPVVQLTRYVRAIPDFVFEERPTWRRIWVDTKGTETEAFRCKMNLWREFGPGLIRIVKRKSRRDPFIVTREIMPT